VADAEQISMLFDSRTRRGLAIAPAVPVGLALLSSIVYAAFSDGRAGTFGYAVTFAMMMAVPISYTVCLVIGFPTHLALKRLGWTSVWAYVVAGAILSTPFILTAVPPAFSFFDLLGLINLSLAAPAAALAFWIVVRPDQPSGSAGQPGKTV
jgi:hypothetical protein